MNLKIAEKISETNRNLSENSYEREELFRRIFESNLDAIFVSDNEGYIRLINQKAEQICNIPASKIIGRKTLFPCNIEKSQEIQISRPGRDNGIAEIRSTQLKLNHTQFYVSVLRDITELVRLREEMRALTFIDDLTGLFNRRGFFLLAQQQLKLAGRNRKGIYMLLISFDNFQQINNTYGKERAEKLLINFAEVLKNTFRKSDIISRFSEDSFIILALEATVNGAEAMAKHLLENLESYNSKINNENEKLLASMGTAYHDPSKERTIDGLLQEAELQLYKHKRTKGKSALLWYMSKEN